MKLRQWIVVILFGILGVTYAQDFYVVAPSSLRLNSDETIAVAVDGRNAAAVSVSIQDHPGKKKTIFQTNVQVQPGKPKQFKIRLNTAQFPPDFLSAPESPKLVSLNVRIQNTNKEILIPITTQSGYMFIQSDKPIYTPLERAFFRIIPLTEDGLPSTERFQLQIKNPDEIIVDEKVFNERKRKLPFYFASHSYKFPTYPVLGEWSAIVRYGNNLEQNSTIIFELQEYVLPTFTVKLKTPNVVLPNHDTIIIDVDAQYVYGKKVNGVVTFRLGVKKEHSLDITYFATINPKALDNGAYRARISTSSLKVHKDIGWFPRIQGSILVVEATVVDDATGNKRVEIESKTRFSNSPFIISFKQCLGDFKPGLTSIFEADINYVDGTPADGILTKLRAVTDNGRQLNIVRSTSRSNENGKVNFDIHPEIHHKTITLTLETADPLYAGNQAKGTFVQRAYQSKNSAYIAISRSSSLRLQPDDIFTREIHFEPVGIQNVYYLVVAKGKIQFMSKLPEGAFKVQTIRFPITYDMVPSFRVIVFAHHGNDLVADSLKIDVNKLCNPLAEVKLEPVFNSQEPGSGGRIIMRGTKHTSVGLLGVDEAVYALSRKDLLTREKMFDRLASHDMGCGPGGGINVNSVLGNAGITIGTNRFSPSHTHSCAEIKRRKRAVAEDIIRNYTGSDLTCCGLGMRPDVYSRDCDERQESAFDSLEAIQPNCSAIFFECCEHAEKNDVSGSVYFSGRLVGEQHDGLKILDPDLVDKFERESTVRKDFRETWINTNYLIGPNNREEVEISLPHSITTWVIQAISVSPTHGMCVAEPKKVVSFKKIFVHLNLPYSIKQYEQVEIQATIFNYGEKKIVTSVYMYGIAGVCSGTEAGTRSENKTLYIDGQSAKTVSFSIIPLKVEDFPVKFVSVSNEGTDVIEKKLHVVPQGTREEKDATVRLDPANRQKRTKRDIETEFYSDVIDPTQNIQVTAFKLNLPETTIPGTARCSIAAMGDLVGPAVETSLNNPDGLIQKPSGCGEQNMIRLAPTIYTLRYLKATDRLTPARRDKGNEFIRHGYNNELNYKKKDGSYSVWAHTPTSTWLTAFVLKVFCQATEFIPIDPNVISSGIGWLIRNQEIDGSYIEKHRVYHREMMGGVDGTVSMTAYALITLAECKEGDQNVLLAKQRAMAYLENRINTVQTPLSAAVVAYSLALSKSKEMQAANDRLLSMARYDQARNYMYWTTQNSAQDIETAGYGLLTQLLFNDIGRSSSIVNWLNTKQLQSGQFKSTQDTVIALQALSEYAIKAMLPTVSLVSNITSSHDKDLHKVLRFNQSNALELQTLQIENPDGMIFVKTAGYGMGTLTMKLRYNVLKSVEEICKFDIKEDVKEVIVFDHMVRGVKNDLDKHPDIQRRRRDTRNESLIDPIEEEILRRIKRQRKNDNRDYALNINICVKYLGNEDAEMSIVDVGTFSGFEPVMKDLERLEKDPNHLIQRYEKSSRGVVFYLEKVPIAQPYCFSFQVFRQYIVGNTQSSIIKVYDYYNPDATCTRFYSPDKNSALLNKICDGGVCECAEGGCPPKTHFSAISGLTTADRRDRIKHMFCEDYSFVWKGKLQGRLQKSGGFLNITLLVQEVIKAGAEGKKELENKTRYLRAQEQCASAQLLSGAVYLIVGKDSPPRKDGDAVYYLYYLDKSSIIHHWTLAEESPNRDLQRDLDYVTKELKEKGCEL